MASIPPWAWVIIVLFVILVGAWATNVTCPTFGRKCIVQTQGASGTTTLTTDQQKIIESYF
jgi:hypothetical protein